MSFISSQRFWRRYGIPINSIPDLPSEELRDQEDIEQEKEEDAEQQSMLSGLANMGSEETPKPVQKKYTIQTLNLIQEIILEGIERLRIGTCDQRMVAIRIDQGQSDG